MFYDNFYSLCQKAGVTPTQVARDLGIRQSTVSMWKKQESTPRYETLKMLAYYFGVSINDLLDGDTAGKISTSIDVAMAATYRKSNKLVDYSTHYKQSEEDIMATALEATKDADPRIYNLLLEYQNLSDEQKEIVLATARQFNIAKNAKRKKPVKSTDDGE